MSAIVGSQNSETVAMLELETNPVGVELFSYDKTPFCSNKFAWLVAVIGSVSSHGCFGAPMVG